MSLKHSLEPTPLNLILFYMAIIIVGVAINFGILWFLQFLGVK